MQVSRNRSLDGVLDQLNSRNITDAGPADLINDDASDDDGELLGPGGLPPHTLPAPTPLPPPLRARSGGRSYVCIVIMSRTHQRRGAMLEAGQCGAALP